MTSREPLERKNSGRERPEQSKPGEIFPCIFTIESLAIFTIQPVSMWSVSEYKQVAQIIYLHPQIIIFLVCHKIIHKDPFHMFDYHVSCV